MYSTNTHVIKIEKFFRCIFSIAKISLSNLTQNSSLLDIHKNMNKI